MSLSSSAERCSLSCHEMNVWSFFRKRLEGQKRELSLVNDDPWCWSYDDDLATSITTEPITPPADGEDEKRPKSPEKVNCAIKFTLSSFV